MVVCVEDYVGGVGNVGDVGDDLLEYCVDFFWCGEVDGVG